MDRTRSNAKQFVYLLFCAALKGFRIIEQAALHNPLEMFLLATIIHLVVEKHLFLKVKGFICSTLSSVISLLLSIYNNQPFISFTSCQNAPFISWKSNPPRWMGRSCHENCKHGGGNVWKRINGPFL